MAGVANKKLQSGRYRAWYYGYNNGRKNRVFFVGTSSKTETLRIARKLEDEHRQIMLGYREAPSISQSHKFTPFSDVVAEYISWGDTQGGRNGFPWSKHHSNRVHAMLKAFWPKELNLEVMGDIYGVLSNVEKTIRIQLNKGKSGKTIRHDVGVLNSFCNW